MKRAMAFLVLLAGSAVLVAGAPGPAAPSSSRAVSLVEELVRMTRAGDSPATVLVYAKTHRAEAPPEIDEPTLRWLREQGVADSVVRYMAAIDVRAVSAPELPEGVTYAD